MKSPAPATRPSYTNETRRLADLKPFPRNPKTHPPEQLAEIRASLREFGWTVPLLIDEADTILAGHGRKLAGLEEGFDEVRVVVARGLSPEQKRAYVIADNRLTEKGGWDADLLKLELTELAGLGFDTALTGFDLGSIDDFIGSLPGGSSQRSQPNLGSLAERFGVPPFSVLNAREGWWQDRKRAWLALGIQSELGRGEDGRASPGGSPQPTVNPKTGKIARANSRGGVIPGTDAGTKRKASNAGAKRDTPTLGGEV